MKPNIPANDAPIMLPLVVSEGEPVMLCSLLLGLTVRSKSPEEPRAAPLDFTGSRWFAANDEATASDPPLTPTETLMPEPEA